MATIILLLASLSQAQASSSVACSQTEVNRTAVRVDSVRKQLLQLPIGDGLQTDVSSVAQQTIASMKAALGDFITAYLHCVSSQPDPARIKSDLSALGHSFEMPRGPISKENIPPDFGKFGFELSFQTRLFENPRLLGVTANFSIKCGSDTVLLIFSPSNELWKEVLRWQKKAYATVAGGTLAFDYGISPANDAGQWFLVTRDVAPWCSSTWSDIRYSVLRPTPDPDHPKTLFSGSDFMWWGNDDFGTLIVQKDEFDLRFHSASIDAGIHNRVWIRHYSVIGDAVRRNQPVAVSPRDFVDEWIVSPWQQASQWSSNPELRQAHAAWSRREKSATSLLEYYSVQRCADSPPEHYQVEVAEETGPKFETARSFYFQVRGNGDYTMLRISDKSDARCSGPNILDEMGTE
ncbi:MAG: GspH/FimT family protein [Candidatus Acidiferrales bacterium]